MIARFLIRYPYLIWLTGFLLPFMYLAYLLNLNRVFAYLKKANPTIALVVAFTLIQILSAILSITYDFFSFERLAAVAHNIFAFTFVFIGYAFMQDDQLNIYIKKYTSHVFVSVFLLIIIGTIYSLTFTKTLYIPSVFSLFGLESKFTAPQFNMLDWYLFSNFPRTQVLGIYPNSTGLLLILLYVVVISLNFHQFTGKKKFLFTLILLVGCFLTGSRTYLLLSGSFVLILIIKNKSYLSLLSFSVPVLIVTSLVVVEYLLSLRTGSNNARMMIYEGSFNFMMKTNPVFGLGVKPRLPEIIGLPYPLGSHSTLWDILSSVAC